MKATIIEKSRRCEYSGWYERLVDRVVYYVKDDSGEHFLHHECVGNIPQYDQDQYEKAKQAKFKQYIETGGQWVDEYPYPYENQFTWRLKDGPIQFIKEVRKSNQTFTESTSMSYCENGACWMFSGNVNEVSNSFYFIIYTKELADEIRAMIPEVRYIEDDSIIL